MWFKWNASPHTIWSKWFAQEPVLMDQRLIQLFTSSTLLSLSLNMFYYQSVAWPKPKYKRSERNSCLTSYRLSMSCQNIVTNVEGLGKLRARVSLTAALTFLFILSYLGLSCCFRVRVRYFFLKVKNCWPCLVLRGEILPQRQSSVKGEYVFNTPSNMAAVYSH